MKRCVVGVRRFALLVVALAALLAAPVASFAAGKDPVLLVHGWRANAAAWNVMVQRFTDEGAGRQVVAINLPGQDNIVNGRLIRDLVAAQGWSRFDLVGVSMGGLSGRYYLKSLGGTALVDAYVSLGSPHYGIWAGCFLSSSSGGQMCPSSSFLKSLNSGDDTPGAVRYTTLWGTSDTTVPLSATRLDGGACYGTVAGVVHTAYEEDANVFAAVVNAIDGGCPGTFK